MDQFTRNLAVGLRRFAMAGVGAITLTVDKSREIIDQLAARGEVSAAEGQVVCDDLHRKLTEQVSSFTRKLRAEYENLSFEQMIARAQKLTPEQKQRLADALIKTPGAETAAEPTAYEPDAGTAAGSAAVQSDSETVSSENAEEIPDAAESDTAETAAPNDSASL